MSHSSKKPTVHNLQTTEDQQQITEEDHQHLIKKEVGVPKIHEPQVITSATNNLAESKPPPPAASPLVAHPDPHNPIDEPPFPAIVEPSSKSFSRKDYLPSSPASQTEAYPYPHPPQYEPRGYRQSTVASPVVGLPQVPEKVSPPASNPPQDYLHAKEVLLSSPQNQPSSRPCCSCIIL
ncbi:hypothetical protein ES332_D10G265200v1 [Gossypium tomentosum]|uniref:Uncharacterized protein n=1 Tax=Gossypium tomentosum TaxID=34277 RepID=A0A5D2JAC6_GOSTO|nr:hypothetical protein ES332_D10G265200v1 [Gossypium tomentosum]